MENQARLIIDKHITKDYAYYKCVCRRYFNGRYLFEDMLHELYLKMIDSPEEKILRYNKNNKLRVLGGYYLRELFTCKNQTFKNKNGHTSPLHEGCNFEVPDFANQEDPYQEIDEVKVNKIKENVLVGLQKKDHDMGVFVLAQNESINSISKRTGINRTSIQHSYDRVKIKLQRL